MSSPARDEIRRLSADDVLAMVQARVLDEDERVELWDGVLVRMSPQGRSHGVAIKRLTRALVLAYGDEASVFCQVTMRFSSPWQLRYPDFVVVLDPDYDDLPHPRDAALVVEVAETSQPRDRRKLALYAAEGASCVWLVDLPRRTVDVFRGPQADGSYAEHECIDAAGELALPGLERSIPAATCFPGD